MRKILSFVSLLLLPFLIYCDSGLNYLKVEVSTRNPQYEEIRTLGFEIWISYRPTKSLFTSGTGKSRMLIDSINYYCKVNGELFYLGAVSKQGVVDKNGNSLKSAIVSNATIKGISSSSLENPLAPNLVIEDSNGNTKETNPFVLLAFDFNPYNLRIFNPDY